MKLRSLEMSSQLLTMTGISHVEWFDDYGVQRTPSEPDFWYGNQLILQSNTRSAVELFDLFEHHFPMMPHRAMVWDMPELKAGDLPDFRALGATVDSCDALTLQGDLVEMPTPDGICLRPLTTDTDWSLLLDLMHEVGIEEGFPADTHRPFLIRRNANRRQLIAQGLGMWFGAFDGDELVGHMGMFNDDHVARYQNVETKITHRRRGICSAMLSHAAHWALDRAPQAEVIIVAEADSDAGRLYRKMGFAPAERIHSLLKAGY